MILLIDSPPGWGVPSGGNDGDLPHDLDARAWRWGSNANDGLEVASVTSGTDNETFTISTAATSGNPPGWYVLEVHGKTVSDTNTYTIA
jgi:hypothetical protein